MTTMSVKCDVNGNAKVKYELNGIILQACKMRLISSGIPVKKFIETCMESYASKLFNIVDGKVVPIGQSIPRETKPIVSKKATIEEPKVEKSKILFAHPSETKEQLKLRELPEFDYPDNIHPTADNRERMEIDKEYEEGQGTLEQMMEGEYIPHRDLFREGQWIDEFWNFTRYCAKKLIRMSGNPKLRYDEDHIHDKLWAVRDACEEDYLIQKANYENSK